MIKEVTQEFVKYEYFAVVEENERNWSGYFPDLPGAVATGESEEELEERLGEVLALHLLDMQEDLEEIPNPRSEKEIYLETNLPKPHIALIKAAEINPISLEIGRVIKQLGKPLRQLEKVSGISYSVLSRLQDPFYWGHSVKSLRAFGEAFGLQLQVKFVAIRGGEEYGKK